MEQLNISELFEYNKNIIEKEVLQDFGANSELLGFSNYLAEKKRYNIRFTKFTKISELKDPIKVNTIWDKYYTSKTNLMIYEIGLKNVIKIPYLIELRVNKKSISFSCYNPIYKRYSGAKDDKLKIIIDQYGGFFHVDFTHDRFNIDLHNKLRYYVNHGAKVKKYKLSEFIMDLACIQNEIISKVSECILLKPYIPDFTAIDEYIFGKPTYKFQPTLTEREYYSCLSNIFQLEYILLDRFGILLNYHFNLFSKNENISFKIAIEKLEEKFGKNFNSHLIEKYEELHNSFNKDRRKFVHKQSLESTIIFDLLMSTGDFKKRMSLKLKIESLYKVAKEFPSKNIELLELILQTIDDYLPKN
ncbi:MAG: hypothetical protein Q8R57_13900 [Bacteroidota bacterium]|nr:hypothetical protein [Bacteroidota bacterium]